MATTSFKKIILTTDLSDDAIKAYGYARSLAERYSATLTALSCIDTSIQYAHAGAGTLEVPVMYSAEDSSHLVEGVRKDLSAHIQQFFAGLNVAQEVRQAPVGVEQTIVVFCNEYKADLVIIASHGRTGIRRALLGSTAEYVLRHSNCPVLVVPTRG
jgi:nucleotide-binding universal stress UspA family protein